MRKSEKKQIDNPDSLPSPSSMDLKGHQSVRATFRLSEACIDTISILSAHLGIKQKSVFDHLLEDVQTLREMVRDVSDMEYDLKDRVQKSFVINRRSLNYLNIISRENNTPRDALLEYSVKRLLPIIDKERKNHEKRKQLLSDISTHYRKGVTLLSKAENALNREDPVVQKLKTAMNAYEIALKEMVGFVEKGKMIEDFQPD